MPQNNFYHQLARPIVSLAPMDGVTDQPFRHIVQKYGQPDVIYTEFVNVEGLCHQAERLTRPLLYDSSQQPIVAQIYGKTPKFFRQVAIMVCSLGFAGVDINMGCPSKSVAGGGSGAALIKTPKLAQEIIQAVQQGVEDWVNGVSCEDCSDLSEEICQIVKSRQAELGLDENRARQAIPVSVKTRLGITESKIETWLPYLMEMQPAVISLHGRTLKQSYRGLADWEEIAKAADMAHQAGILMFGNGDVQNRQQAEEYAQKYGVDGVLIGRAVRGNPFVFAKNDPLEDADEQERARLLAQVALEHAQYYEKCFFNQERRFFLPMRKHLAWYMSGFSYAKEIRKKLVRTNSSEEVREVFKEYGLL